MGHLNKEIEMKKCYIADGVSVCQAFPRFADARKCADSAPWADGRVYRVAQHWRDSAGFAPQRGRLGYTAPGAPFAFPLRGGMFDD